jgi:Fe-S oxidoreductase
MCPTYRATGEDLMATRGRANVIRAVLDGRLGVREALLESPELDEALGNCLSCKACTSECPSNVNMTLLKAELLYARWRRHGTPLSARLVSRVDLLGVAASMAPRLANASLQWGWLRLLLERHAGLSQRRPLPPYADERFDHWFRRRMRAGKAPKAGTALRGKVFLWDDCFVRHNEPEIGIAAVRVLEAAGYEVALIENRACCGRPAFSMGCLDVAERFGRKNAALLAGADTPIVFLEPSCYSMFKEDYRELKVPGAEALAQRAHLFEHFVESLLDAEPDALSFQQSRSATAIHAHCHTKALSDPVRLSKLAARIPGNEVALLNTGCCGMAGAFGAMEKKYDLSVAVGKELADLIAALKPGTRLVASGTSCRHQIEHLTQAEPLHMAELLAEAIAKEV